MNENANKIQLTRSEGGVKTQQADTWESLTS